MNIDPQAVINKLLQKNTDLTMQNAMLETAVDTLTAENKDLNEQLTKLEEGFDRKQDLASRGLVDFGSINLTDVKDVPND